MKRCLWIDDLRNPPVMEDVTWDVARTLSEALDFVKNVDSADGRYAHIAFDHDLGVVDGKIEESRGVIKWLYQNPDKWPDTASVQSQNGPGAEWLTTAILVDGNREGCTLIRQFEMEKLGKIVNTIQVP